MLWHDSDAFFCLVARQLPLEFLEMKIPDQKRENKSHLQIRQLLSKTATRSQAERQEWPRLMIVGFNTIHLLQPSFWLEYVHVTHVP